MSQTQRAETQTLPKAGSTRRCPNCAAPAMAMKRWPQTNGIWQVTCSRCGHLWQEHSARSFIDTLRESPQKLIFTTACLIAAASVAFFALSIAYPMGELIDLGRTGAVELSLILIAALVFIVGAAYAWRHSILYGPDHGE